MTKFSQVNRYYLYFAPALLVSVVLHLLEIDPLYLAVFLQPIFFAMLFAHPNVDNFKEYKISRFSFVNLLFFLEKRFSVKKEFKFSENISRHAVAFILFCLLTCSMSVNFLSLYLFFFLGVGFFELTYSIYKRNN